MEDFGLYESGMVPTGNDIIDEAKRRRQRCVEWEAKTRELFLSDLKFRHGDSDNGYQWPGLLRRARDVAAKPCLTINLIGPHNRQITNEARKNKKEVKVLPVGDGATVESARILQNVIRKIQNASEAQFAYILAQQFQVDGGIGYWRLLTRYIENTFDQEILIEPILDPLGVYLDPDIKQRSGRDAEFGFVFDLMPKNEFREKYPEHKNLINLAPLGDFAGGVDWGSKNHVMICEYFRKVRKKGLLISFVDDSTNQRKTIRKTSLPDKISEKILEDPRTRTREELEETVEWIKIAGETIIEETTWPGKFIPIIRCVGEEVVIDGQLDRKGHTRSMKDAQRMLNYNASGQVEFVALQGKTPWTGAADAIENFESYWNSANRENHSYLPFKHLDANGDPIPPQALPRRIEPPVASQAHEAGMQTAFNQIMMVSGQWQNQMGMMGNERTGEAIKQRQDQGDTATFHFQDNFEAALIFTGEALIDLIPKIYDTKRIELIQQENGLDEEIMFDPGAQQAFLQKKNEQDQVISNIFNPMIGRYQVQASAGQAFGTKREQTVEALTLILTQAPGLTGIIGDLLLSAMDFDKADEAAQRLRRMVPPIAMGKGPSQQEQTLMLQNQQLRAALAEALEKLGKESLKLVGKSEMRDIDSYKAITERLRTLLDAQGQNAAQGQEVLQQAISDAAKTHLEPIMEANAPDLESQNPEGFTNQNLSVSQPPIPGASQAQDGQWYLSDPTRRGKYLRIAPLAQDRPAPQQGL